MSDEEPSEIPDPAKFLQDLLGTPSPEDLKRAELEQLDGKLKVHNLLNTLDPDQLEALFGILGQCALEGQGNYKTFYYAGMLQMALWAHRPPSPDDASGVE